MATISRENIGVLHDKIIVKLTKEDYLPTFEKKIKEYSKTVNIPGFRKGFVPTGMIKKMYGEGIFADEVIRTAEKELNDYLQKENPEIFGQPLPITNEVKNLDHKNPTDYDFEFEIGLKPSFELPSLSDKSFQKYNIAVTEDEVTSEVERLRLKGGVTVEPETIESEESIIYYTLTPAEGNQFEKEDSTLLKFLTPAVQAQLKGKKVGDQISFTLKDAFEKDALEAMLHDVSTDDFKATGDEVVNFTINKINLVEKREIDETFLAEIKPDLDLKTEDDLRNNIREEIKNYNQVQAKNQLDDQIYHALIDNVHVEFPVNFLKRWIQVSGEKPKSAEEAEKEYPNFESQLKWMLIHEKIQKDNNIEVKPEEIRENMRQDILRYFGGMPLGGDTSWIDSYVDRMMKDRNQIESAYNRTMGDKVFKVLHEKIHAEEKEISSEEFTKLVHNHHH